MPIVPLNALVSRLRQTIPRIILRIHSDPEDSARESTQWLHREPVVIVITDTQHLERELIGAMRRLNLLTG